MVYHGPSRGCHNCRKRRVKCDEAKPHCSACTKRKQTHQCVYRDLFGVTEQNGASRGSVSTENDADLALWQLTDRVDIEEPLYYNELKRLSILVPPTQDKESLALSFFFSTYVTVPREARTNIYLEHILPIYSNSPIDAPVRLATAAVAANLYDMWGFKGADTNYARHVYSKAVSSLRDSLAFPVTSRNMDSILGAIFMLDFYETLSSKFKQSPEKDMHLEAAMNFIKTLDKVEPTSTTRRLLAALRTRYITFRLQARKPIRLSHEILELDDGTDMLKPEFDVITAKLANLLYDIRYLIDVGQQQETSDDLSIESLDDPGEVTHELVLMRCMEINLSLDAFLQSLPSGWKPHRNQDPGSLHPAIRAVGLYNELCDVYTSTSVCHVHNRWRTHKITVLRLINHCLEHISSSPSRKSLLPSETIDGQIESLVDGVCASVPFLLGSRTSIQSPYAPAQYPPVPASLRASVEYVDALGQGTNMTDQDHALSAAASGGWFLLIPISTLLQFCQPYGITPNSPESPSSTVYPTARKLEPLHLRDGQLLWLLGQMRRIQKLYLIGV